MEAPSIQQYFQCRLCLQYTAKKVDIFKDDFPKMIEILTSLKVTKTDSLPKQSCISCAREVKNALITRKRILKSYKVLCEQLVKRPTQPILNESKIILSNEPPITIKTEPVDDEIELIPLKNIKLENSPMAVESTKEFGQPKTQLQQLPRNQLLRNHINAMKMKIKKNNKPLLTLRCDECKLQFTHRVLYSLHMAKHKKSKCDICGKLIRSDNFRKHVALHTDTTPAKCDICGVILKNNDSLRGHIYHIHRTPGSKFVCDQCGQGFKQKSKFELHKLKSHGGERTHKCQTCGKMFYTNVNLINHVNMTHKKLRPHICEYCGKGFSGKYALKTHVRQHTNEAPYKCGSCGEGFRQKVSLRAHLKSKHSVEEECHYFCATCNRGFITDHALKVHERLHLMQKCQHCSEHFAEQSYLDAHMNEVHKDVIEENEASEDEED